MSRIFTDSNSLGGIPIKGITNGANLLLDHRQCGRLKSPSIQSLYFGYSSNGLSKFSLNLIFLWCSSEWKIGSIGVNFYFLKQAGNTLLFMNSRNTIKTRPPREKIFVSAGLSFVTCSRRFRVQIN